MSLLYTFSTGSTEVYSLPSYSSVTSAQTVSQINTNAVRSVYNPTYEKIFVGPIGGGGGPFTGLTIFDSGNTKTVISITGETFGITMDYSNDLIAVIPVGNPGGLPSENTVTVIDASNNNVNYVIEDVDGYKGGIASSNDGYCYVVGRGSKMTKVDILNGVTADTTTVGGGVTINRKVIFNTNNSRTYVHTPDYGIEVFADMTLNSTINLTGNTDFYIFNPDKDYIYVGNITGGSNDFTISTINCSDNSLLSETFIYSGVLAKSGGLGPFGFYSTDTGYLYVGDTDSDSILVLTT